MECPPRVMNNHHSNDYKNAVSILVTLESKAQREVVFLNRHTFLAVAGGAILRGVVGF